MLRITRNPIRFITACALWLCAATTFAHDGHSLQGVVLPAVEPMIAASLLITGLLVVSRLRVPGLVAALGVGVFAVFHGVAHGYELAGSASAWWTLAGMLTATVLLHSAGLAAGWALRHRHVWVARAAGAGVAAFGGALLAQMA